MYVQIHNSSETRLCTLAPLSDFGAATASTYSASVGRSPGSSPRQLPLPAAAHMNALLPSTGLQLPVMPAAAMPIACPLSRSARAAACQRSGQRVGGLSGPGVHICQGR